MGQRIGVLNNTNSILFNEKIHGEWTKSNLFSKERSGSNAQYYSFSLSSPTKVKIDLQSDTVGTFLYLKNGNNITGSVIASSHDFEGKHEHSQITHELEAGNYCVEATTYRENKVGNFTLEMTVPE